MIGMRKKAKAIIKILYILSTYQKSFIFKNLFSFLSKRPKPFAQKKSIGVLGLYGPKTPILYNNLH
tara:strand:- start:74 stop:271 length:198 start_codon:yes stop_codon:yes gene_type:complete